MQRVTYQPLLADQIFGIVLEAICSGRYSPGERLCQDQIAQSLNVSRQPVLQALGLLKAHRFLCNAGRRGLMVAPFEAEFVADLYEYRSAIDVLIASKAALLCTEEQATQGELILDQGAAARKSASLVDLSMADMAFHRWIYEIAGNGIVIETMGHYWNHIRRVMCAILSMDDEWPQRVWEEHRAIHAAIVAKDGKLAEELAGAHVKKASEALCCQLRRKPQSGRAE